MENYPMTLFNTGIEYIDTSAGTGRRAVIVFSAAQVAMRDARKAPL